MLIIALVHQGPFRESLMTLGIFSNSFPCQHLILRVDESSALYGPVRG